MQVGILESGEVATIQKRQTDDARLRQRRRGKTDRERNTRNAGGARVVGYRISVVARSTKR